MQAQVPSASLAILAESGIRSSPHCGLHGRSLMDIRRREGLVRLTVPGFHHRRSFILADDKCVRCNDARYPKHIKVAHCAVVFDSCCHLNASAPINCNTAALSPPVLRTIPLRLAARTACNRSGLVANVLTDCCRLRRTYGLLSLTARSSRSLKIMPILAVFTVT